MTREEAKRTLQDMWECLFNEMTNHTFEDLKEHGMLDNYSTAFDMAISALSENKGEWITDKERLGYWISTCSECGHIFHGNEVLIYKPKFCSNCGARMREG